MPRPDPFVSQPTAEALRRNEFGQQPRRQYGPLLSVTFPTAGATRQIAHGLGVVPTGHDVCWQTGAAYDIDMASWTADIALMTAPDANTQIGVQFYVSSDRADIV